MQKKKYDFIIPIGWGCLNAHNLRKNHLQRESLPFDWMWVSHISIVTNFLKNRFQNFMLKDNLKFIRHNGDADIYRDTVTHVEYWHDFMIGEDFNTSYEKIYQKYQRRINRMFYHIEHSSKILWVRFERIFTDKTPNEEEYMFQTTPDLPETTIQEFNALQKLFPSKKSELLLIYTWNVPHEFKKYDLNSQIHVFEIYNDETLGWKGNETAFANILKDYDLTFVAKLYYAYNTSKYKLRKLLLQLFAILGLLKNKKSIKIRD